MDQREADIFKIGRVTNVDDQFWEPRNRMPDTYTWFVCSIH